MDRTERAVIAAIRRFKSTGNLPKEYDVVFGDVSSPPDIDWRENVAAPMPYVSEEAEIFSEGQDVFLLQLTPRERSVYDVCLIGGLGVGDAASVLGVTKGRLCQIKNAIMKKAEAFILKEKLKIKRAALFFNM